MPYLTPDELSKLFAKIYDILYEVIDYDDFHQTIVGLHLATEMIVDLLEKEVE